MSNKLTITQYLLVKIAEEAVEVAQRATKAITFGELEVQPGQDKTNLQRLADELRDLHVTMRELAIRNDDAAQAFAEINEGTQCLKKRNKLRLYMGLSVDLGILPKEAGPRS